MVFKVSPTGVESVLHRFTGGADGANPAAGLVRNACGNLYGTTQFGGSGNLCQGGCGTVFEVTPLGAETVLYSFSGLKDGGNPAAGLIEDAKGNLYGTTVIGGEFGWARYSKSRPPAKKQCSTVSPEEPTAQVPTLASSWTRTAISMARLQAHFLATAT